MRTPFWIRLAWREAHASVRRLGVYMAAISLGVAALVAINSFRAQVIESVDTEAKSLLGADLRLTSNRIFPDTVEALLDSATAAGVPVSRVTTTLSVALTHDGRSRLAQLKAVTGEFPYYGAMVTRPAGMWRTLDEGRGAFVEPALLDQLGAEVGDSIRLGVAWFEIRGELMELPPELSFRSAIGPRIYIHGDMLEGTGLLRFGSLAQFEAFLKIPDDEELQRFVDRRHDLFSRSSVDFDTAAEQAENLAQALEALTRFLGLVGLSALLLGGLGVASAVNVFVKEKRRTVAILRCLGATQRTAFGAYLLQATVIGLLGALAGVLLGIGIQSVLPHLVGDLIPVDVQFAVQWDVAAIGVAIGAVVAATFALLPLLEVRGISPLRALRHDVEQTAVRVDAWRGVALALILAGVVAIAIWQARLWQAGLAYAGAITGGMILLWLCARLLMMVLRRSVRIGSTTLRNERSSAARGRAFTLRQGTANLYRPRNQTTAVVMAVGFGVFLIATLWVVQHNLLGWMRVDASRPQPDLVLLDIQRDQTAGVTALLQDAAAAPVDLVPMVPARITAINGRTTEAMMVATPPAAEPWALRREYRNTYRDTLTSTETLTEGTWFDDAPAAEAGVTRVSVEEDVARDLRVNVGDHITWDVGGAPVRSVITSMRRVEWTRVGTNFFFVFEPGIMSNAPQTFVALARVDSDSIRSAVQRSIVMEYPNISVIDVGAVQRMMQRIIDRVIQAIRFMSGFSVAAGALVLFGAVSASRFQRVRESALLRALGATRAQIRRILLVEYIALGALAAFTGVILAGTAGWLLMRFLFRMEYSLPLGQLAAIWFMVTASAALIGMLNSREALRSTPLAALREAET